MIRRLFRKFLLHYVRKDYETLYSYPHLCSVCGDLLEIENRSIIVDELASDWNLTVDERRYFDFREGSSCIRCGSSVRLRNLGETILEVLNRKFDRHFQWFKDIADQDHREFFRAITIAEINSCATLHPYIMALPNVYYSEFGSADPNIPSEDLMHLTYSNDTFDLVLMTDVLEHVPDVDRALDEIGRILKPNGSFIFTVPMLFDRRTRRRALGRKNGRVKHLLDPSYHGDYSTRCEDYLVFYEFGSDFIFKLLKRFKTSLYCHDGFGKLVSSVFLCEPRR